METGDREVTQRLEQALPDPSRDRAELRELLDQLIGVQLEGIRLAKRAMLTQEIADSMAHLANRLIDAAAANPADAESIDRALETAAAAGQANDDEFEASIEWMSYLERTDELVRIASELARRL